MRLNTVPVRSFPENNPPLRHFYMQHVTTVRFVRSLLSVIVLCASFGVAISATLPGLTISSSSTTSLSFRYEPTTDAVRPRLEADGSTRLVFTFDVIVPSPDGFRLETANPTSADRISIRYTGVARDRHVATVEITSAITRNGITTTFDPVDAKILFAPYRTEQNKAVSSARTHLMHIGAVNDDAPWTITPQTLAKRTEDVQVASRLDNVWSLKIDKEGVYRLSADQLKGAGIPTDADAARTLKIFGYGGRELSEQVEPPLNDELNEQPILVRTNADGSINDVLFYAGGPTGWMWDGDRAQHYLHHYETYSSYLITFGGDDGVRGQVRQAADGPVVNSPLSVTGLVFQEEELVNPYNSGSGRRWYGRSVENGGALTFTTPLPGLIRSGEVQYHMVVAHKGTTSGVFTVSENGIAVAQRVISGVPQYMDTYSAPASGSIAASSIAGDGRSVLRFAYECSDRTSTGLIDWFEIHYPRGLVATNNEFMFFTDPNLVGVTEYAVNGFGSGEIVGLDVTDPAAPVWVQNIAPSGGIFSCREEGTKGNARRYYITSSFRTPGLTRLSPLTLRNDGVEGRSSEMIVICDAGHLTSAKEYAAYRESQGELKVSVVTTDAIFNEFSYGVKDPTAFRDYLGYLYRHATIKPAYVLLWGDGHFDYKNISTATPNYIIPYESLDPDDKPYGLSTYTTDDFFVRVQGNDSRPDMAIGRLPIVSNTTGSTLIEKIKHYETESATDDWRTRITMIADDGQTSEGTSDGALHLNQSERLANEYLPDAFQPKKVYLVQYPTENVARGRRKPSVTQEYVSTINTRGSLLLNWIGHGNPRVWAHEFVFERETTPPQFTNIDKPFFLTAATCDFARFDLTDVQSGAEELVLRQSGGAIGVFSASRVVYAYANAEINQEFYKQLFTQDDDGRAPRLGDVMYRVKQRLNSDNDEKFYLLGDPALRLLIPSQRVVFETINDTTITDTTLIKIQALSTVTVTGRIERYSVVGVDDTFNGTATISLLDAKRTVTVTDTDDDKTQNDFTLPGAALSRGSYKVENGKFTATFVVPKDIAFSSAQAQLYGYAFSDDQRTAMGSTDRLIVDGVGTDTYDDREGPSISIFMDSRYFRSGDVVRWNPILIVDLADATGINTTGVGIGHNIEATFDNGAIIETLTETFTTSLEDPRAGTATKQIFALGEGHHTVTVRAWDVLNNMSEASASFRIASTDEGIVSSWVMNYPNPFSNETTIRFQHNFSAPFNADLQIYDTQGRLMASTPMQVRDMQTAEVIWDGRDTQGNAVGSGIYVVVVQATDTEGRTTNVRGKLALIR